MSSQNFMRGEVAHIALSVSDALGAAVDPGGLLIRVRPEGQSVFAYTYGADAEIVRSAVGEYYIDLPLASSGAWYYRWELSGANAGAGEGSITVDPGHF